MTVEYFDLPNGQHGIGMANYSPSRNCAFAVVMAIPRTKKSDAVVMFHGRETARFKVEYPLHVFITNDCVGVFYSSHAPAW